MTPMENRLTLPILETQEAGFAATAGNNCVNLFFQLVSIVLAFVSSTPYSVNSTYATEPMPDGCAEMLTIESLESGRKPAMLYLPRSVTSKGFGAASSILRMAKRQSIP